MQAFHFLIFAKFQNIPLLPVVLLMPFLIFFCHISVVSYLESFDWRVDYVISASELEVRFNLSYYCFVTCFIVLKRLVIIILRPDFFSTVLMSTSFSVTTLQYVCHHCTKTDTDEVQELYHSIESDL